MKSVGILGCAAWLLLAAAPAAAEDKVSLNGADAAAFGDDQAAIVRGTEDYLLALAGNPDGKVFAYDAQRKAVRISPEDRDGIWLSCAELKPMETACSAAAARPSRGPSRGGAVGLSLPAPGAVPSCPGDPRCPRLP